MRLNELVVALQEISWATKIYYEREPGIFPHEYVGDMLHELGHLLTLDAQGFAEIVTDNEDLTMVLHDHGHVYDSDEIDACAIELLAAQELLDKKDYELIELECFRSAKSAVSRKRSCESRIRERMRLPSWRRKAKNICRWIETLTEA